MSLTIPELNKMNFQMVLENEDVKTRVISVYEKIQKRQDGEVFYEKEKYNLTRIIAASDQLKSCTGFSVYGTFLDIASMGITTDQGSNPMLYIMSRGRNMYVDISPYGELTLRIHAGQILHVDRPVVVYEGDEFQPYVQANIKMIDYKAAVPRISEKIIASFICITRPNGSVDSHWMLPEDIARLQGFSNTQNGRYKDDKTTRDYSNKLYKSNNGQIDIGFLEAKTIKHAMKTFPKIKLGQFSKMQQSDQKPNPIDYGLEEVVVNQTPEMESFEPEKNEPGHIPEEKAQGVKIDLGDEEDF